MTHLYNLRIGAGLAALGIAVCVLMGWSVASLTVQASEGDWGIVEVSEVTKTGAKVTITLADDSSTGIMHWRYRSTKVEGQWLNTDSVSVIGGVSVFYMTSLSPGTEYELQVSVALAFSETDTVSRNFTTIAPDPSVSEVMIENVTSVEGTVVITIANPGTSSRMVYVRYRAHDSQPWSDPPIPITTATGTATETLSGLTPGTRYQVEVSLGDDFLPTETASKTFTTLLPRVSRVDVVQVSTSEANVKITIAEPGPGENTVHLRYGTPDDDPTLWTQLPPRPVVGETESFRLAGLSPGTEYKVEASLDSAFIMSVESVTFTTTAPPSIGSVSMAEVGQISARAIVSIFDPDGSAVTVYLRYRESPYGMWSAMRAGTTVGDFADFVFSGLMPDTLYEVEVSLDSSFSIPHSTTFATDDAMTTISSLATEDITRTTAGVTLSMANFGGRTMVYMHYRAQGMPTWGTPESRTTYSSTTVFNLMKLTPDTLYEVEVSLDQEFPAGETLYATFITGLPANVSEVSVDSRTHTGAIVTVSTEDALERTPVYLRYRSYEHSTWLGPETRTASSGSASFALNDLTPDTEYVIAASTDLYFSWGRTVFETFTTSPAPRISRVSVGAITDIKAALTANINRPQPGMTGYLRYRVQGEATWVGPEVRTTSSSPWRITLMDLMPSTLYEVEASLDIGFSDSMSTTFTTAEKGPTVSGLGGGPVTPTAADVIVNLTKPRGGVIVYLRYRVWGSRAWTNPETRTTSTAAASFDLTQLTPGTTYEIQASLDRRFPAVDTVSAILTTAPAPRVSVVVVESVTHTEATVTVSIAHPEESTRMVYMRYRELPEGDWNASQTETDTVNLETVLSDLAPGMGYEVQASLHQEFPATHTREQKFNTLVPKPVITPTLVPTATPTPALTPEPAPTPIPTLTPEPMPTPTLAPESEPTITPTPSPSPSPTPLPSLAHTPTATPSHTPTPINTPKPAESPTPTSTAILNPAPQSPTPAPTLTPHAEEEKIGTDLALVITIVTMVIALAMVTGFFVHRRRTAN